MTVNAKKIVEVLGTAGKVAGSVIVTAAIAEAGFMGARLLETDVEFIVNSVDKKLNPIEMKKRHWYSKPEEFNVRKQAFVADLKKTDKKSK